MNITFQRKLDRILGTFICRIISFFHRKHRKNGLKIKPKRILIILLSEMGSLVLAYPMFQHIKKKFPGASVHVLLFEKNKEILAILGVIPSKNILTINDISMIRFTKDSISVLVKMYKMKFDTVIDCELFLRISSIFSFFSGAAVRVGFHPYTQEGLYRGNFINRPVLYNPYHHISQQFITLVEAIDSNTVPKAKLRVTAGKLKVPLVAFKQSEIQSMMKRLHNDFPDIIGKKLVLISPSGGILPIRAWPLHYFCRLSADLIRNGYAVGVIGLENDQELANVILSYCQNPYCISLTGYTNSIRELMIIFHLASLLITNDGGPGHFAVMTPVPTIIFYGPETPTLYGTLDEKAIIFYVPLSCSPCLTAYNHRNSPCNGDNLCLKYIHPDQVVTAALEILKGQRNAKSISI